MNNKNISTCRLCLKRHTLCKSHIFPEFFYDPMYDAKHRLFYVSANLEDKIKWEQKGLREYLLCRKCETQLSRYEDYTKKLFFGGDIVKPKLLEGNKQYRLYENVDYKMFKLFQLSLLWRAGITSRKEFSAVKLGLHEEKLRKMIQQENTGQPSEYGCVLFAVLAQGEIINIVTFPCKLKIDGHTCYRFMLGGFYWLYFVSSHSAQHKLAKFFLQHDGKLIFLIAEAKDLKFLTASAHALSKRKDEVANLLK